jgi:hypothetical protein
MKFFSKTKTGPGLLKIPEIWAKFPKRAKSGAKVQTGRFAA